MTKETIWITGCSGFLGTRLLRQLSSLGHKTVGLSRRGCPDATRFVKVDLAGPETEEKLKALITETCPPDVVVHAASKQPGPGSLSDFVRSNVQTTLNLLEVLRDSPPRQIIYTSTLSVYQDSASLPAKETEPACGTLPYGATKRWSEQLLESFQSESLVTILRLPSLYGAGQADSFIDGLARSALKGASLELFSRGETVRDALYVNDAVNAITACLARPSKNSFSILNLGCGRPITTLEYARALVAALESKSEVIPIERRGSHSNLYADISRARHEIGFEPTPLTESMRQYADELRTQSRAPVDDGLSLLST